MVSDNGISTSLTVNHPPPGMGKWNRSKRRLKLQQSERTQKRKITKQERREKYTAIAKERQMKQQQKDLTCFRCRQKGHSIQYCTNAAAAAISENSTEAESETETNLTSKRNGSKQTRPMTACCYKCGSTSHTLASCPEVDNDKATTSKKQEASSKAVTAALPFATCFICQQQGHIASQCTQNTHGIYINGDGQCKYCQSIYHRGSQCPNKNDKKRKKGNNGDERLDDEHFDVTELIDGSEKQHPNTQTTSTNIKKNTSLNQKSKKQRVVIF